ncbi:Protein kes1, partial [Smittium mucronatum]
MAVAKDSKTSPLSEQVSTLVLSENPDLSADSDLVPVSSDPKHPADTSSQGTSLLSYFKSLLTFKGDIFSLTSPSYLLSGQSLLELSTHWGDYIQLLLEITHDMAPREKVLYISRWMVSQFKGSYNPQPTLGSRPGGVKKPYNPILGEQFHATFPSQKHGDTILVCEQVSHHPPITAVYIYNEKEQIYCNGFFQQKVRFSGTSVKVDQFGHMTAIFKRTGDFFMMSLPDLVVSGLFSGNVFMETNGKSAIVSNLSSNTAMNFYKKPWLYGAYNKFDATIYSDLYQKTKAADSLKGLLSKGYNSNNIIPDYKAEGVWDGVSTLESFDNGDNDFDDASSGDKKALEKKKKKGVSKIKSSASGLLSLSKKSKDTQSVKSFDSRASSTPESFATASSSPTSRSL